jgi:hypothetical protein
MRILKIDEKKLFRVCNPCGKEIKANRVYGTSAFEDREEEEGEEEEGDGDDDDSLPPEDEEN